MAPNVSDKVMMFAGVFVLVMFISYDVYKAYRRGAKWLPGNALVLCVLCVQLLGYLDVQNVSIATRQKDLQDTQNGFKDHELEVLIGIQLSIDSSRLVLLVFVGYLLPSLASDQGFWSNIVALCISLSTHIAIELYVSLQALVSEKDKVVNGQSGIWLIISGFVLLQSTFFLSFLVIWALISGRFIRDNLSSRIPSALSGEDNNETLSWETCKCQMLKSWIVTRVCQPEYVLGRTLFSVAVGGGITFYVAFFGVKVIFLRTQLHGPFPLFVLQFIFIILGWFVVVYRCFIHSCLWDKIAFLMNSKASIGFLMVTPERYHDLVDLYLDTQSELNRSGLLFYLIDTQRELSRRRLLFYYINTPKNSLIMRYYGLTSVLVYTKIVGIKNLVPPFFTFPLWAIPLRLFLFFSRFLLLVLIGIAMVISEGLILIFYLWYVMGISGLCVFFLFGKLFNLALPEDEEFDRHREALEWVCMPREDAKSLWVYNLSSFNHLKHSMEQAYARGKACEELKKVIRSRLAENCPPSMVVNELLEPLESVRKYFPLLKDSFRRITARSLLIIMMHLMGGSGSLEQSFIAAYKQAKELMDLVDCPDNVGVNVDAFSTSNLEAFQLRTAAMQPRNSVHSDYTALTVESAFEHVQKMYDDAEMELHFWNLLGDFPNAGALDTSWTFAGRHYSMYKVCKTILRRPRPNTVKQLVDDLFNMFADIMASCVRDSPKILLKHSKKWAAEFREDKISAAIELAGFAWGVIDDASHSYETSPITNRDTEVVNLEGYNL